MTKKGVLFSRLRRGFLTYILQNPPPAACFLRKGGVNYHTDSKKHVFPDYVGAFYRNRALPLLGRAPPLFLKGGFSTPTRRKGLKNTPKKGCFRGKMTLKWPFFDVF